MKLREGNVFTPVCHCWGGSMISLPVEPPPRTAPPAKDGTPPRRVGKRAVRILLECFLVDFMFTYVPVYLFVNFMFHLTLTFLNIYFNIFLQITSWEVFNLSFF